jgi:transposase
LKVDWKDPSDAATLTQLIQTTTSAKQRDRYRVVLLSGQGLGNKPELEREEIAAVVDRSRAFVDQWVGRYRSGGLEKLVARKQKGAASKLNDQQMQELQQMLDDGPTPEEGLAAYNGPILREKIQERFKQLYSLPGLYALLHRLRYNDLMPRTTHPDTDPAVQEDFKKKSCPNALNRSSNSTLTGVC